MTMKRIAYCIAVIVLVVLSVGLLPPAHADTRLRIIIETDAGGDPDDEQSLVPALSNEWDVEGIICNRRARDGENLNPERTGLGIVQAMVRAYGECYPTWSSTIPATPRKLSTAAHRRRLHGSERP